MPPPTTTATKPQNSVSVNWTSEFPARSPLCGSACSLAVGRPELGKSWEWTSLPWTTRRVEALKRGLQVVSVRTLAKTFLITSVSLGDTTKDLVAS